MKLTFHPVHSIRRGSSINKKSSSFSPVRSPVGTPEYMSPELVSVWHREPGASYNHMTDMWSLGVLLFYVLYAQKPFDASCAIHSKRQSCKDCDEELFKAIK